MIELVDFVEKIGGYLTLRYTDKLWHAAIFGSQVRLPGKIHYVQLPASAPWCPHNALTLLAVELRGARIRLTKGRGPFVVPGDLVHTGIVLTAPPQKPAPVTVVVKDKFKPLF